MTFPLHKSVDRLDAGDSARIEMIVGSAVPDVTPALALCVWRGGRPVLDLHGGWVDPAEPTRPVHGDAMFDLASLTKPFTATAFLRLASQGRVGLDDKVASVLPEFAAAGPRPVDGGQEPLSRRMLPVPADRADQTVDPGEVTLRQLLIHTSGMAPWRSVFRESGPVTPPPGQPDAVSVEDRSAAAMRAVFDYAFVAKPGSEYHYSDLGMMALGWAVSRVAGMPLDGAIQAWVAEPLGLQSLRYSPVGAGLPQERIVPTSEGDDWRERRCWGEVEDENAAGLGGIAGHAGLFDTARELARFGQAWLERDARLGLSADIFDDATIDQTPDLEVRRGLGWQLHGLAAEHLAPLGLSAFGHTGFTGTSLAIDPERDLVIVLLTNRVYAGRTHEGIDQLRVAIHEALA